MHNTIMQLLEKYYEQDGIQRCLFPTPIPESFLTKESDHIKGFGGECFWIEKAGNNKLDERLALRPTSETAFYSMMALWISSYKDLPMKLNQTCSVFRYETKNTKPLIRVREIPWNEAHTAHATYEEALQQIATYWKILNKLFNEDLCIYGQKLTRAPWDKFAGAEATTVLDVVMPCGRVLQAASAHDLKQKFAEVFKLQFKDQNNVLQNCYQTCCGVSTRALAACLSVHGDQQGLVLPRAIAMYEVVIVKVGKWKEGDQIDQTAKEINEKLQKAGIRSCLAKPQLSFADAIFYYEMKGVPCRIDIGKRDVENKHCVVTPRDLQKEGKKIIELDNLVEGVQKELEEYNKRIQQKAKQFHEEHVQTAYTLKELGEKINERGGFVKIPFYDVFDADAKKNEDYVKEACGGGEIRGYVEGEECIGQKCAVTGKDAKYWVYVARAY